MQGSTEKKGKWQTPPSEKHYIRDFDEVIMNHRFSIQRTESVLIERFGSRENIGCDIWKFVQVLKLVIINPNAPQEYSSKCWKLLS